MSNEIRVLIINDQKSFREWLVQGLVAFAGLKIVGVCGTPSEAVEIPRLQDADIVVVDYALAWEEGELLPRVRAAGFDGRIVVLTGGGIDIVEGANLVRHGVSAICSRNENPEALVEVIRLAAQGVTSIDERYFRPALKHDMKEPPRCSAREELVIRYLKLGLGNPEIAARLGVSVPTVKLVLHRLYQSRGVRTRGRLLYLLLGQPAAKGRATAGS